MSTIYYADKLTETRAGAGNVLPIDTGGRIRAIYDELTIGQGDIPDPCVVGSVIYFGGGGIPRGARVLYALPRWEDLSTGAATIKFSLRDALGNENIIFSLYDATTSQSVAAAGSDVLAATSATGDNAPLVGARPVFPTAEVETADLDIEGDLSVRVFYTLD